MRVMIDGIYRVLAFSTTTPLAGAGVYTSPTIDAINYKAMTGLVLSDQAGTYFIQYSDDGTNWTNSSATATTVAANTQSAPNFTISLRYVRFVYTNGATIQGSFRFSAYVSPL